MEILSHASPERRQNLLKGFKFPNFVGCFHVTMAVKGLTTHDSSHHFPKQCYCPANRSGHISLFVGVFLFCSSFSLETPNTLFFAVIDVYNCASLSWHSFNAVEVPLCSPTPSTRIILLKTLENTKVSYLL